MWVETFANHFAQWTEYTWQEHCQKYRFSHLHTDEYWPHQFFKACKVNEWKLELFEKPAVNNDKNS